MMLLTVPFLLPLLIEAEITKNIPICICILIDKLFSGQRKSRQVQICTELTKLTYRIGMGFGVHSSGDVQSYPGLHGFRQNATRQMEL